MRIGEVAAGAKTLPPRPNATRRTLPCPLLPSPDGQSWGRDCTVKKLNVEEQIALLGRIRDGVRTDKKRRAEGDPDAPQDDNASYQFHESLQLLVMACLEPSFDAADAVLWMTTDEVDGIGTADVVQFLLFHIRSLNDEQEGLEDVANGLMTLRKMPQALQTVENAYLAGPEALRKLLEGDGEMAQFIERWGAIIAHVVFENVRKRAKIEAEENAAAIIAKLADFGCQIGWLKHADGDSAEGED